MSEENVEIARSAFETWNAGDMDALRELYDPDVIVRAPEGWPEPGPFVGREAVMREFAQLREDRVVVRSIWHGVGRGPQASMEWTVVYTMRNRRVFHLEFFWDHAEALEAVGLAE